MLLLQAVRRCHSSVGNDTRMDSLGSAWGDKANVAYNKAYEDMWVCEQE